MDYPTFKNAINALEVWRIQTNQKDFHFPDSRDPAFQKISQNENITAQDFEKAIVCLCGWREDREELSTGMLAIVSVITNRSKAGWFGGNQYSNVVAKDQFSSMTIPDDPQLNKYPQEDDVEFGKVLANIDRVYDGTIQDRTNGALYYANLKYVTSGWFLDNIVRNVKEHPVCASIGRTTFFK